MIVSLVGEEFSLRQLLDFSLKVEPVGKYAFLMEVSEEEPLPIHSKGRVGIAHSRFVAECAARTATLGTSKRILAGEEALFLAPLPVSWLPVEEETLRRLQLLGIQKMGQLVHLGKDALYFQFGEEGILLFELAQGIDERPLAPHLIEEHIEEQWDFDTPCPGGEWLKSALLRPLSRLFDRIPGLLCMGLKLKLKLEEGKPVEALINFAVGTARVEVAHAHIWQKVSGLVLASPITSIRLAVAATAKCTPQELLLFASKRTKHLPNLCERLKAKGRPSALMQLIFVDPSSRLPERRGYLQSLLNERVRRPIYAPSPVKVAVRGGHPVKVGERAVSSLLDKWRLVEEWWTPFPIDRLYFQLCLESGARLRLFSENGRWYRQ